MPSMPACSLTVKRIYHTWDKWECYPAGFYESRPKTNEKLTKEQIEAKYAEFLSNDEQFTVALERVITEWKYSCEHYLSNENMNRIAWLGQASACLSIGVPSTYCGGFNLLSDEQQERANLLAFNALNKWIVAQGEPQFASIEEAASKTEANLY